MRLTRLLAPPPAAITAVAPTNVTQGTTGVTVTVAGAATGGRGFFDPGASFPRRLTASFSGTGVTVTSVVVNSPTTLTLTVNIAVGALPGVRTLTVTNPDGQTVSLVAGLMVETATPSALPSAPRNLTAVVARDVVVLTWQAPTTATTEQVSGYLIEAGFSPGETLGTLALGNVLTHTITGAPSGVFYVRLRAQTAAGLSPPSNEVQLATGQSAPPLAPQALLATVQGTTISLRWTENPIGPAITGYYLQAGTAPGLADLGALPLPPTARTFAVNAAPGTYFVRVVAVNAAGASVASNEVMLAPGLNVCTIPDAPTGFVAVGVTGALSVRWDAAQLGAIPTGYVLQAGSVSGAADLGTVALGGGTTAAAGTVPSGPYFLRVFAANVCGTSAPSTEVSTLVP